MEGRFKKKKGGAGHGQFLAQKVKLLETGKAQKTEIRNLF